MKREEIFRQWKASRSNVPVPDDFTSRVMQSIKADKTEHLFSSLDQLNQLDQWMPSVIGRWSATLTLLMLGLFRIFFMVGHLIGAGSVAP